MDDLALARERRLEMQKENYRVYFRPNVDLVYDQVFGTIAVSDAQDGRAVIGKGYSGAHGFANNSIFETHKAVGPIPRGVWKLGAPIKHEKLGPVAIPLTPEGRAFGRTGFYIHGDNKAGDGTASKGCIILDRATRDVIAALYRAGVRVLYVN